MRAKTLKRYIDEQAIVPENEEELGNWFKMYDVLDFVLNSGRKGMVPVYSSNKKFRNSFYSYSLIVPEENLKGDYITELMHWSVTPSSGYGYGYSSSEGGYKPLLFDAVSSDSPHLLEGSTPIFFLRECNNHTSTILEINQKISHVLEICWSKKRKSFCKLNDVGDYVDVATMNDDENLTLCTLNREDLEFYLYLSKSILITFFDIMRHSKNFSKAQHDKRNELTLKDDQNEIFASLTTEILDNEEINLSWMRGFHIIRNEISNNDMMKKLRDKEHKEYESFIICDFRNKRVVEWSCDPDELSNYFIKSDKPFETSPAFFKPEVLSKYKQDPEKYKLEIQSIECRGSWSLNHLDTNEEGQIIAFIYQLSALPSSEQKYWKSFNEEPKSGLSKRAIKHYFLGEWDTDYDPLISFKNILETFPDVKVKGKDIPIWKMPNLPKTRDINFLNYVVTDSTKEWEDQISAIYQILIEGLQAKNIKLIANNLKCRKKGLKSIKQLIKCLEALNIQEETIDIIVMPLFELNDLRSKLVAHTTSKEYPEEDLKVHYKNLLEKCDKSMRKLADLINQDVFNIEGEE